MNLNTIDRANPQKLYHQLLEILKEQIEKGEWKVGAQMPTEDQLGSKYNVSKATVRLAIAELASQGYLKKLQGKGTFIRRKKSGQDIAMLVNLGENSMQDNPSCLHRIIETRLLQPEDDITKYLNLFEDDSCFFLSKLLIAEGKPLVIHKIYISYSLLPGPANADDTAGMSPYTFIENKCGVKIHRIKNMIDLADVSEKDAGILEVTPGMAVLRTRQICYAHGDVPISFSESFYRTDVYPKVFEFERLKV